VTPRRAVGRRSEDGNPTVPQTREFPTCVRLDVDVLHAFERDEVVVETDLVPKRLDLAEAIEQVRTRPVRRCVEDEVGTA
jgi:hypothetical protein